MDPRRFDALARSLATIKTRRGFLGTLAAAGAGLLGAGATDAQVTQRDCGNVLCGSNPGVCKPGCVCCTYSNGNSRCTPPGNCTGTVATTTTTPAPTTTTTTAAPTTTTTTAAPTTTTTTTTTAAPTCAAADVVIVPGPPTQAEFTVQETGSGLAELLVTRSDNADTVVPPFTVGTNDPLVVTATKINQSQSARVEFRTTALDGTIRFCDVTF